MLGLYGCRVNFHFSTCRKPIQNENDGRSQQNDDERNDRSLIGGEIYGAACLRVTINHGQEGKTLSNTLDAYFRKVEMEGRRKS